MPRAVKTKTLTVRQQTKLANMHLCRRRAIQRRMRSGMSFSAAEKSTKHVFDTCGWHEVRSRLARARGIVCGIATKVAEGRVEDMERSFQLAVHDLATRIASEIASLLQQIISAAPRLKRWAPANLERATEPYSMLGQLTRAFAIGQLRAAHKLVAKCSRDAPLIEARGGAAMSPKEQAAIRSEICRIQHSARRLQRAIRGHQDSQMTFSNRPNLTIVPYSRPIAAEPDDTVNHLLAVIRLIRLGYSHSVIVREIFGDSAHELAAGRRALRRLRCLGFSVAAERAGKTEFSRQLAALIRDMAGQEEDQVQRAIDDLLAADGQQLARMLLHQQPNSNALPEMKCYDDA